MVNIYNHSYKQGFTLVEISIVLIIIGLLVSGVMAGKSLIYSAKLRTVVNDVGNYRTAVNAFQLKYGIDVFPGDFDSASTMIDAGALDGDGDGQIECNSNVLEETPILFQHLALAGYISGQYDGDVSGCTSSDIPDIGEDYPEGPFDNSFYSIHSVSLYNISGLNTLQFSAIGSVTGAINNYEGVVEAADAKNIDTKMDDGIANTGKVFGIKTRLMWGVGGYSGACITGTDGQNDTGADYNLADTGANCTMRFSIP